MCIPAVLESGGDEQFIQDERFSFSTSGSRSRSHPLEGIPFFDANVMPGSKGQKARERAKVAKARKVAKAGEASGEIHQTIHIMAIQPL